MSHKRTLPDPLKTILQWDVTSTNKVVKFIDRQFGPLIKYREIFKGLEISCHGIPWLIVTAAMVFLINISIIRRLCVNLFLALLIDIAITAVVKASTRRRRPIGNVNDMFGSYAMDKFSFPSGHATRAVMLAFLLPYKYSLIFPIPWMLMAWCGAVCASRVLMKRHHLLDVLGGIVIGWLQAVFISNVTWLSDDTADALVSFFLDETRVGASYDV